jgi:heptosyltransferase III
MKAAVIPSKGIGDALLMMIASHQLLKEGFSVTTFHPSLNELKEWFPRHRFAPFSFEALHSCDLIIVENDNSSRIQQLRDRFPTQLGIFYPTYFPRRHPVLTPLDRAFDPKKTMVENIAVSIASLLKITPSGDNGLIVPSLLAHRIHAKRVILHPSSSVEDKNWPKKRFLLLANKLKKKGFHPVFALSPKEKVNWQADQEEIPDLLSLDSLARLIYESGFVIGNDSLIGHLASNLNIPTLIIANDPHRMNLWRPGWKHGEVMTPASWIPNLKFFRLRQQYWKQFISTRQVLLTFERLVARQKRPFPPLFP